MYKCKVMGAVLIAALLGIVMTACSAPEQKNQKLTLVLDWTPNTNHTGFYAAKDLGYYNEEGLEVEIIQPPEDGALSLVAAKKADFAISFQEPLLLATNTADPLPVAAVAALVEHNTGGILSLKEKGITRFRDMEGKTYGSWETPIYDEIVRDCIRLDGGNPDLVQFVPNAVTDNISGISREFDTVWVYEGWDGVIANIKGVETNFFFFRDINPVFDYYSPILVTNQDMIDNHSDTLKAFLRATEKGYAYAKENPDEAADILSAYAPEVDKAILLASQRYLSEAYYDTQWGVIEPERWNAFFEWMKSKALLPSDASHSAFVQVDYR